MTTVIACLDGLARYLGWWLAAFVPGREAAAPLSPRRLAVLLVAFPIFFAVQVIHTVFLLLDDLIVPGYRRQGVEDLVMITGLPRSGTTALHQALAAEGPYATAQAWEVLVAPAITQRRLIRGLARLDRWLGRPAERLIGGAAQRLAGGLAGVHETGLTAPEEDYLALLPAGGCFVMALAFPGAGGLRALAQLDSAVSPRRRARLMRFYRRLVQRHRHVHPHDGPLLAKNAAFGSWVAALHAHLPGTRFVICVRAPETALSSQISASSGARTLFGTRIERPAFQHMMLDAHAGALSHLAATVPGLPAERAVVVAQEDLKAQPTATLAAVLARLGRDGQAAPAAEATLASTSGASGHRHDPADLAIDRAAARARLLPPYERLMDSPNRVRPAP